MVYDSILAYTRIKLWSRASTFKETFIVQEHTAWETAITLLTKFSKAGTQVTRTKFEQVELQKMQEHIQLIT